VECARTLGEVKACAGDAGLTTHGPAAKFHPMISFRPVALPADESLLLRIYRSTRELELDQTPWTEAEKHSFICMQFSAQHTHYHAHYPDCEYLIILKDGIPIGRLYIDTRPETIHIIDIALLAPHRKQGIGSRIMSEILAEAQRLGRDVGIYVEAHNNMPPFQCIHFIIALTGVFPS
jgi:GNAT superfamily N-acetyltransferase